MLQHLFRVMIPPAPPCFDSRSAWVEYVRSAAESQVPGKNARGPIWIKPGGPAEFDTRLNYCADCSSEYRAAMLAVGRCNPAALRDDGASPADPLSWRSAGLNSTISV